MPIMYVNPAPTRRRKKTAKKKRSASGRRNPSKKGMTATMAKTKRRRRRKKNPMTSMRSRVVKKTRRRKKNPMVKRATKRSKTRGRRRNAWSEKKTATKTRKIAPAHSKAARKGWRKRKSAAATAPVRKGRKKNPARRMRRHNPAKSVYARRYGARRRKRNPSNGKGLMGLMTQHVLPVAASLYASRLVSGKLSGRVPLLDRVPEQFRQSILAGGMFAAGHYATKKVRQLQKYRNGIMIGLGVNLLDKVLGAFAPESVKSMFGISNYGTDIYGPALSDYVAVNDYVAVDGTPIQDNITLSEYVAVDGYEGEGLEQELGAVYQDLGEVYQDLGAEQDLGDFADRNFGGVSRSAMRAPVGHKRYLAPVPARSFTAPIPAFGGGFDKPEKLYTGVFAGGLH